MTVGERHRNFTARVELRRFLELLGVYTLAVAQPVLSVFGKSPETFVQLGAGRWVIVTYTLIVLFIPPLLLWGLEQLVDCFSDLYRRWFHIGLIGLGVGLVVVQAVGSWMGRPVAVLLVGAVATVGMSFAYARTAAVRTWTAYLSAAALVFAVLFLGFSPVSDLVFPHDPAAADVQPSRTGVPVVLIVFDEFPTLTLLDEKGMIDGDLFPSFSALADDATWYRNATSVHALTHMSVPAIETGQIPPEETAAPTAAVYPESIFTLLGDSYAMNSVQEYTVCPTSLCPSPYAESPSQILGDLLSRSVDIFTEQLTASADDSDVDTASGGPIEGRAGMVRRDEGYSDFVAGIDGGQTLSAAHMLVPHHFWVFNPSGTVSNSEYEEAYPVQTGGWGDPESAAVGRQHHLLQAMYIDSVVGNVIERLDAVGAYDDALIIVTADHGISFEPGEPRRLSTAASIPEVAWVPMFVKFPDQDVGVVSDENAMTIDVVPTIAEIVGIDIPWDVDGISLVSETRDESDKVFLPYADNPEDFYPFGETVDGEAGLNTLLSRAKRRFVHTADPRARPFARGRYGNLVGGRVADFNVEEPLESAAVREDDRDTEPVDAGDGLEREMAATWVAGSIADDLGPDPQLAYVIDGTIVATSGVFEPEGGRRHFETLLPEDAIDAGPLETYLIDGTLDRPTLREVVFEA